MSKLPYCKQYSAAETKRLLKSASEEKKTGADKNGPMPQRECIYWDGPTMARGRSPVPGTLFMPTRVKVIKQKHGCQPAADNEYACDTKPWVHDGEDFVSEFYPADIERFTVLINHAFSSDIAGGSNIGGRASDFQGYEAGRPELEDFFTKRKGYIQRLEKDKKDDLEDISKKHEIPMEANASSDFGKTWQIPLGDIMSVGDLLKLCDIRGAGLLDYVRRNGESIRYEGGVIQVDVTYSNAAKFDFWGHSEPHYTITAKYMPMHKYSVVYDKLDKTDETKREVHKVHGLLFLFTVKGEIRAFTLTALLTMLTTALVSLTLATTITDFAMSYCFSNSVSYDVLKYQPSADFSDLRARVEASKDGQTSVAGHIINKAIDNSHPTIQEDLLTVLAVFETRLNKLDGVNPAQVGDAYDDSKAHKHVMAEAAKIFKNPAE
jgi:hypothetical protein